MPKKTKQDQPQNPDKSITGTVERVQNSNDCILSDISEYMQYLRDNINYIIQSDGLMYSEPMDTKKIYPAFTYTQFLYLLKRLFDVVFSVNTELLCDKYIDKYNKIYSIPKVELCYEVYYRLCTFYGFNVSVEPFYNMTGIDYKTLQDWLSCGRSKLLQKMQETAKNDTLSRFDNSTIPILNLASANYKYKLQTPLEDRQQVAAVEVLPDLLQLPGTEKSPGLQG